MLANGREDVDGQLIGVRIVNCDELKLGILSSDKGRVAGQAIELVNDELGFLFIAAARWLPSLRIAATLKIGAVRITGVALG